MHKFFSKFVLAVSLLVIGAGPVLAKDSKELAEFKKAIRAQYDLKEKAWAKGDYESIVTKFYSDDAISIMEGMPETTIGVDSFRAEYKTILAETTSAHMESVYTHVNGNLGWDFANFEATVKPEFADKYPKGPVRILFLWEKVKGKWICKGDAVVLGAFKK